MKKFVLPFFLIASISTSIFADCTSLVTDLSNWVNQRSGRYSYQVGFDLSVTKAPAKFVGYSTGVFTSASGGTLTASQPFAITFSDRQYPRNCVPGSFCIPDQGFDITKADKIDLRIAPNGTVTTVLRSWGNSTYNVPTSCSEGFMYGILREPNGNSILTLSFKKITIEIPR